MQMDPLGHSHDPELGIALFPAGQLGGGDKQGHRAGFGIAPGALAGGAVDQLIFRIEGPLKTIGGAQG